MLDHFQTQNIPVADAKPDDIQDLLGGALFQVTEPPVFRCVKRYVW